MSTFDITTSFIYRWRYIIGYGSILLLFVGLLYVAGFLIPGGLSENELSSVVTSSTMNIGNQWHEVLPNAPFHLLQKVSLALFGVTMLGIKLPALLIGVVSAVGMVLLLRRWFSPGIAVLASVVAVTTGQFLFLSQQGSTGVLYVFWPVMLLLLATLVAARAKYHNLWKLLFFMTAALSLYTPLSSYVLIAMASAAIIHPHLRFIIKKLSPLHLAIALGAFIIFSLPLIISVFLRPSLGLTLLGIPHSWPNFLANVNDLAGQYFGFMSLGNSSILLPIFGLASMLIILYGLYRSVRTYETVQSHVIITWTVLLLPVLILNPRYISIMFVPLLLLLASGLEGILRRWYRLFPRNPYARITGLIPLIILVGSMVLFGLERYAYGYRYNPDIVRNFSDDVLIVPTTETLVVTPKERPLYAVIAKHTGQKIMTKAPTSGSYAATAAAKTSNRIPSAIITTDRSSQAARFYLYK